MEWLKLDLATIRSEAFIDACPVQRATWLSLLAFSADAENNGRISRCAAWKDRKWQQLCGVTLAEIQDPSPGLWSFDGDDLLVGFYPAEQQARCQASRANGAKGGRPPNPPVTPPVIPTGNQNPDLGETEQSRAEESRVNQSRAEQSDNAQPPALARSQVPCKNPKPSLQDLLDFLAASNGTIADHHRAEHHAEEFIDEMKSRKWHLADGSPVKNGLALFLDQLKRDGILLPH